MNIQKREKKCNCENVNDDDNMMNYLIFGGILVIMYMIYRKKC